MKKKISIIISMILLLTAVAAPRPCTGAEENKPAEARQLFSDHRLMDITLAYDLKGVKKCKKGKEKYFPAVFSFTGAKGKKKDVPVEVKPRGNSRRFMLGCDIVPLKIKFPKEQFKGTVFEGISKLNLVPHCKSKPAKWELYYIQEYLLYRVYNLLTDYSYRVRGVRATYVNTGGKGGSYTGFGFFIEGKKEMSRRLGGSIVDTDDKEVPAEQVDFAQAALMSVFQYMIANTDWSGRTGQNVRFLRIPGKPKWIPVPYDFDLSGIIDTHYAVPHPDLPIRSLRERIYRGYCKSTAQFNLLFPVFRRQKEAIYAMYNDCSMLPEKQRKKILKFLDGFYKVINDPKLVKRYFIDNYRGRKFPLR